MDCILNALGPAPGAPAGLPDGVPAGPPHGVPAGSAEELANLFDQMLARFDQASGRPDDETAAGAGERTDQIEPAVDGSSSQVGADDTAGERSVWFGPYTPPPLSIPEPMPAPVPAPVPAAAEQGAAPIEGVPAARAEDGADLVAVATDRAPAGQSRQTADEADVQAAGRAAAPKTDAAVTPDAVETDDTDDTDATGDTDGPVRQRAAPSHPADPLAAPAPGRTHAAARALARTLADLGVTRNEGAPQAAATEQSSPVGPPVADSSSAAPSTASPAANGWVPELHRAAERLPSGRNPYAAASAAVSQGASISIDSHGATSQGQSGSGFDQGTRGRQEAAVGLHVSAPDGAARAIEAPPAFAAVAEHVQRHDRLEARPAAAPHAPPADSEPREVTRQLVQTIRVQARDGVSEAHVRLRPEHLGEVRIALKIEGDRVAAVLHVERADVRHHIESQSQELRASLAAVGLHLDELTVREDGRSRQGRDSTPEQEQPARRQRRSTPDKEFELDA
jgi:flagellar hook-length control protein FliK